MIFFVVETFINGKQKWELILKKLEILKVNFIKLYYIEDISALFEQNRLFYLYQLDSFFLIIKLQLKQKI